ncbi:MAG: hypothetical protein ACE5G8_14805, partial [Anaerolineae bacterium]
DRAGGTLSLPVLAGEAQARRVGYVLSLAGRGLGLGLKSVSIAFAALYTLGLVGGYRRRHDARWRGWIEAQGIVAALATVVPF